MDTIMIEDICELEDIIADKIETEKNISVIGNKDMLWEMAMDFQSEGIEFDYIDLDTFDYDKEYCLEIKLEDNIYTMSFEPIYNYDKEIYFGVDGLVYVWEDVNSRFITDVEDNKYITDFRPVIFEFKDSDCKNCELEKELDGTRWVYYVPSCFDYITDRFDKVIDDFFEDAFR